MAIVNETVGFRPVVQVVGCVFCLLIGLSNKSYGIEWTSECVDRSRMLEGLAGQQFAMDSRGILHAFYGGFRLYHAFRDSLEWDSEIVDMSEQVGASPSLAIDSNDRIHVVYEDNNNGIKYAQKDETDWIVSSIPGSEGMRRGSLDVDSENNARVVCWDENRNEIIELARNGEEWERTTVLAVEEMPSRIQLKIDENNESHVCVSLYPGHDVRYIRQNVSEWENITIGNGRYFSLDVDSDNKPHVVISDYQLNALVYLYLGPEGWLSDSVMEGAGAYVSIALDTDQKPHISTASYCVEYLTKIGEEWTVETAREFQGYTSHGEGLSLVLDENNDPHLCYISLYDSDVQWYIPREIFHHSWKEDGAWELENIPAPHGGIGRSPSLEIDSRGYRHIMYCNPRLMYALNDDTGWSISNATVSDADAVRLTMDSSDIPHVVYHTSGALFYFWNEGDEWTYESIDNGPDVKESFALCVDRNDFIHVAYHKNGLRYAVQLEEDWATVELHSGELKPFGVGVDENGVVCIGYYDSQIDSVGYAVWDGVQFSSELIDACCSPEASLAFDGAGNPHMSYTNDRLNYAHKMEALWAIEVVDDFNEHPWRIGSQSSLALAPGGDPCITYSHYCPGNPPHYDASYDPHFAFKNSSGWHIDDSLDDIINHGSITDLEIGRDSTIHVAVYALWSQGSEIRYVSAPMPLDADDFPIAPVPRVISVNSGMPVSDEVEIRLILAEAQNLNLSMYDLFGRRIYSVFEGFLYAGSHNFEWNCQGFYGASVPNGTYLCSAKMGEHRVSERIVVLR